MRIIILEDNLERQAAMRAAVADRFPSFAVEFFAAAQAMIARLEESGLYDVALISLDHDLELIPDGRGRATEPGTGVDVAAWLAGQPAIAPVIVHTTNTVGGDRMSELLAGAGWRLNRTVPYDGTTWISNDWRSLARGLIVDFLPSVSMSSLGTQIICSALRSGKSTQWSLRELLRAAATVLSDGDCRSSFCIEFLYLSSDSTLREIAGTGLPVLRQFVGAAPLAIIEESVDAIGQGPIAPSSAALEPAFASALRSLQVGEVQLELVQPRSGVQAILFAASVASAAALSSHRAQASVRELKTLLEIVLLFEMQSDQVARRTSESILTPPPRRN